MRGIAYTNQVEYGDQNILCGLIRCDPADPMAFLEELHDAVTAKVAWESEEYENGHVYLLNSPENFTCLLRIWHKGAGDEHYPNCFAFQFLSNYEDGGTGWIHHISSQGFLPYDPFNYFVWANQCQVFIAREGVNQSRGAFGVGVLHRPYSVCGGVLHPLDDVAPASPCESAYPIGEVEATTEIWWSAGDDNGDGVDLGSDHTTVESFRSGHICKRFSFCHNGITQSSPTAIESQALQLVIMRPPGYGAPSVDPGWNDGFRFYLDQYPVQTEPFLALNGTIYGQLWDCMLLSAPYALEATERVRETKVIQDELGGYTIDRYTNWVNHTSNFTNASIFSSRDDGRLYALMLFLGVHSSGEVIPSNYAY